MKIVADFFKKKFTYTMLFFVTCDNIIEIKKNQMKSFDCN